MPPQCPTSLLLVEAQVQPSSYWDLSKIRVYPLDSDDTSSQQYPIHTWYHVQHNIWCDTSYPLDEAWESRRKSLRTWIYSSTRTWININTRSNMVWRLLAYDHSTQQSSVVLHRIYLYRKVVGGMETNLIADQILSKLFPDMNWMTRTEHPLKISIGFLLKYSGRFVPGFSVINSQIPTNRRNPLKSRPGPLIFLLESTRMTSSTNIFGKNIPIALK